MSCCGGKQTAKRKEFTESGLERGGSFTMGTKRGKRITLTQDVFGNKKGGPIEAKIILLGDSGVGKSSVALRYCKNEWSEGYDVTIGMAYL